MTNPRLAILQRKLGLVPEHYPEMSPGMERIARQSEKPVPDTGGIGMAIEKLITDEVETRVREEVDLQRQQLVMQQPAPVPVQPPVKKPIISSVTKRDEFGRIKWFDSVVEGGPTWRSEVVARDELGAIRSVKTALLTEPAPPALPYEAEARQYRDGEPR